MINKVKSKEEKRKRNHSRVRSRIAGKEPKLRLAVYRSNRFVYAQIIDDSNGTTLVQVSTQGITGKGQERSREVGKKLAEEAKKKKISKVVFDRGGFLYSGKIKALAEGAREGGLVF